MNTGKLEGTINISYNSLNKAIWVIIFIIRYKCMFGIR